LIFATAAQSNAQEQHEDEIVANLAGGRAIVHVAKDVIIFAPSIVPWREIPFRARRESRRNAHRRPLRRFGMAHSC